jgi:membrane-associated phospholipid phosphatase
VTTTPYRATTITAAIVLLAGFLGLASVVYSAHAGTALDHRALDWFVAHRQPWLTTVAIVITDIGSPAAIVVLAFVAAALIWWRMRATLTAVAVLGTVGLSSVVSTVSKVVVGAERPPATTQLLAETDHSFPSGHVTGTVALLGILAVVIGHRWGRTPQLLGLAAVAGLVVAATRLYLGVHWLTDVVGGALLGSAAVLLGTWLLTRQASPATPTHTPVATGPRLSG